MADAIPIKDGGGNIKNLVADKIESDFVPVHTLASTVTGSIVTLFYKGNGWDFGNSPNSNTVTIATQDNSRKSIIINNNSEVGNCYLLVCGSTDGFVNITDNLPQKYSVLLEPGSIYFGDYSTAALKHMIYVPSVYKSIDQTNLSQADMTIAVTEIY